MAEIGAGGGSSYPGALDINAVTEVNAPNVGKTKATKEVVEDLTAATIAIETELGIDPAGTVADVKPFLQTQHDPNGTHPLIQGALNAYATASLPAAGTAGRLARVT